MSAKYPRTPHLPWSPGGTKDDRRMLDIHRLLGAPLVLTEKLDGSNLCLTREKVFARSHSGAPGHPSFDAAKALHAKVGRNIPEGLSVFGEWCYAVHSISYEALPAWFHVFAVRHDGLASSWWGWDEVQEMAEALGVPTVPVLLSGVWPTRDALEAHTRILAEQSSVYGGPREGLVVRTQAGFLPAMFPLHVAKWVRQDHVQTDEHWSHQAITKQTIGARR